MVVPSFDSNEFLQLGFEVRGFKEYQKIREKGRTDYFRALYGTSPLILAVRRGAAWYKNVRRKWPRRGSFVATLSGCFGTKLCRILRG